MRTDSDLSQTKIASYEQQILNQKFELARLKKQLNIQELKLTLLHEICRVSTDTFEVDCLLDSYMEMIMKAIRVATGSLLLIDQKTGNFSFKVAKGEHAKALKSEGPSPSRGIASVVAQGGQPYFATDLDLDPQWKKKGTFPIKSILCVPLKVAERTVGVIELINKLGDEPFSKEDLDLLASIGSQMAVILENARLFREMEKRVNQVYNLMELSTILNSTLQQKQVLQRAMEAATRLMGTEVGSLLVLDQETQELVFEVALGEKGKKVKEIRLKLGEGIAGWVAQTGEPLLVPDVRKDPRHYRKADKVSHFVTKNMLCVPVKVKNQVIGVLQAVNKLHDEPFAKEDLDLFAALANQVAIAIENARLYEEMKGTFLSTAEALAEAIEKRDPYTGGHTRRVRKYCLAMARHLSLSAQEKESLRLAAILHDIGKIGVRDDVLRKKGKLTNREFAAMKEHPRVGAEIMAHIKQLQEVIPGIRHHQERNDGMGYPDGLRDGDIPLVARIIAVADTFDALTTDRPYRKKRGEEEAVGEIRRCIGSQFDEGITKAFLKAHEAGEIRKIMEEVSA